MPEIWNEINKKISRKHKLEASTPTPPPCQYTGLQTGFLKGLGRGCEIFRKVDICRGPSIAIEMLKFSADILVGGGDVHMTPLTPLWLQV